MFFKKNKADFLLKHILIKLIFIYYLSNFSSFIEHQKKAFPSVSETPLLLLSLILFLPQCFYAATLNNYTVYISGSPAFFVPSDLAF